jgi:hypothetical protein
MVKCDEKRSIGVDVYDVRGSRCWENVKIRLSFIHCKTVTRKNIAEDCNIHDNWANGQFQASHSYTMAREGK